MGVGRLVTMKKDSIAALAKGSAVASSSTISVGRLVIGKEYMDLHVGSPQEEFASLQY